MINIHELQNDFKETQDLLIALGDETRQHIILTMMNQGECVGKRVGEIGEMTHLSRASVSHHLHVLKEAGLINVRKEGRKNYYYFDVNEEKINTLIKLLVEVKNIVGGHDNG